MTSLQISRRSFLYGVVSATSAMMVPRFARAQDLTFRTFEIENGIAKLIRDKRLDLAYRAILMNNDRPLSIKELAYNCGFSARSQFSRFFQERFGITPKELHGLPNFRPRGTTSAELFHEYIAKRATRARNDDIA